VTPATFSIAVRDLSGGVTDEAAQFTRLYTVPMFYRDAFVGSGTLIAWDGNYGILTAQHIPHNPEDSTHRFEFNGPDKLGLSIAGSAHRFELEMQHVRFVEIGRPASKVRGPDLAVIVLPSALIGALKAKLSFWNISVNIAEKMDRGSRNTGFCILAGSPAEWVRAGDPELGMSKVANGR
jgi:hypothetical protein